LILNLVLALAQQFLQAEKRLVSFGSLGRVGSQDFVFHRDFAPLQEDICKLPIRVNLLNWFLNDFCGSCGRSSRKIFAYVLL